MFKRKCCEKLEDLGDKALDSDNFKDAIKQYTAVEPLIVDLEPKFALLLKRSTAHLKLGKENWNLALTDADEVQSSSHVYPSCMILYFISRQSN